MDVIFEFTHFMQSKSIVSHRPSWDQRWRSSSPLEMVEIAELFIGIEVLGNYLAFRRHRGAE